MYCPNCGKTNSTEQRFCRSCGLGLEKVVESLSEQLLTTDLDTGVLGRQRRLELAINIIAGSIISILVGGVLWGIIYEIIIVKGEVVAGSLFLTFIIGLILFALLVIYRESLMKRSTKRRATQPSLPQEGASEKLLSETYREPLSSVTERTTRFIKEEK
jgi:MFS family permease